MTDREIPFPRDAEPFRGGRRVIAAGLIVAAVGLVTFVLGLFLDTTQALAGYLIAYFWAITVVLGLLGFVMGAYAMNAAWPTAIRRVVEMAFGVMPLLLVLYLPLVWSSSRLYPWAHPERIADHHVRDIVLHKLPVMNRPFFHGRAVLFLVFWTAIAEVLRRASLRMDREGAFDRSFELSALKDRLRGLSSLALPFLGITGTFAAFDWVMSLSPVFYSTMYGLYVLSGGFVASIGLIAILMRASQSAGFLAGVNRSHWYAIGRLLFAFLIFWGYTAYFQLLLIWIGNKPDEVTLYLERLQPGDRATTWFLVYGHFLAPWLILLSYAVKRRRATVTLLGAWIFACHYIDIHWLVGARRGATSPWSWQDVPPLLFVCGLAVAFATWRQRGELLSACHDPDYRVAIGYESR